MKIENNWWNAIIIMLLIVLFIGGLLIAYSISKWCFITLFVIIALALLVVGIKMDLDRREF